MERFEHQIDLENEIPYALQKDIDFSLITMGLKQLPFFKDDLHLGMQAINVGIVDSLITTYEYALLRDWIEKERTPEATSVVSALSQMWVYGLYEVLRMWRDRRFEFSKLLANGGIDLKLPHLKSDDESNATLETRRNQLIKYRDDANFRDQIESTWNDLEPVYRLIELFRMNLAKHCAPGKDGVIPRAPGYGRINRWCGSLDYELIEPQGFYSFVNRRDIADSLREMLASKG